MRNRYTLLTTRRAIVALSSLLLLAFAFSGKLSGTIRQTFRLAQTQPQLLMTNTLAASTPTAAIAAQIQVGSGSPAPLKSGYIPPVCYPYTHSDQLVDCWLMQYPTIANSIVWYFDAPNTLKAWPQWGHQEKLELQAAVKNAVGWFHSGMTNYPSQLVPDPPMNLNEAAYIAGSSTHYLVHSKADAWRIYLGHVGLSLAAEIYGITPWSLRNYSSLQLNHLFNGAYSNDDTGYPHYMFAPSTVNSGLPSGYVNSSRIVPTNATYTYKFLKDNDLIGQTPKETIGRVVQWARRLTHVTDGGGGLTMGQNNYAHWQYYGGQTVSRTIEGTVLTTADPNSGWGGLRHWTNGCSGTTAFLIWVLRAVNIPAIATSISPNFHTTIWFSGENLFLSHGDDPYNNGLDGNPPESMLLNEPTFKAWFRDASAEEAAQNVGRRPKELSVRYPSQKIVADYCKDVKAGNSHATGKVYNDWFKRPYFTLRQLEAAGLWDTLKQKAISTGTCQP